MNLKAVSCLTYFDDPQHAILSLIRAKCPFSESEPVPPLRLTFKFITITRLVNTFIVTIV